jgi:aryl-phospho-beta-D-glucosidase BglC (GH1 family)
MRSALCGASKLRIRLSFLGIAAVLAGTASCSSDDAAAPGAGGSKSSTGGAGGGSTTGVGGATAGTGTTGGAPPSGDSGTPAQDAPSEAGPGADDSAAADAAPPVQDGGTDGTVVTPTHYDPNDFLKVEGTRIKNGRGEFVSLYGTNLGGWLVHEQWMSPLTGVADDSHMVSTLNQRFGAATAQMLIDTYQTAWIEPDDFAKIAAEGLNFVRVPIYYLNVMDAAGNWKKDAAGNIDFTRMDWAVTQAGQHGLYAIIDLHGVPGSQNGYEHSGLSTNSPTFFQDANAQAVALKFWTEYAKHYANNSFVAGYDMLNEPTAASGQNLWSFYDRVIATIRAADPNHIIFVEAPWHWNQLPGPSTRPTWTNVIYSVHNYQWMNNNDINVMRGFVDDIMNDANAHFSTYNVPLIIGEFTLFGLMDAWTYGLNRFSEQPGINWSMWAYKVRTTNSSWGLYNLKDGENSDANVPNVSTDSQATISTKWSAWRTSQHFQRNNALSDIVKANAQKNQNLRHPVYRP